MSDDDDCCELCGDNAWRGACGADDCPLKANPTIQFLLWALAIYNEIKRLN